VFEVARQPTEHEHEQHGGQRFDGHLGQGKVGRALDDEQPGHGVARRPQE
jgi:hypothetical protein